MIEDFERLNVKCFLCKKIVEKLKKNKTLTEDEEYHLSVDISAIKNLRAEIGNSL